MTDRPLVSVITATRNRHPELVNAIGQVRHQTYRPLEHVIVADGPDPELRALLTGACKPGRDVPIIFQETGRCWSDEMAFSPGAAAFQVAQLLGHGELQMWFSDDEEMDPRHVELLVDLLESTNSDFVYSKALWYTAPGLPPLSYIIGTYPPHPDQLTNCLYRTALMDYGKFETHMGRGTDWYQVDHWMKAGASYALLNEVTFKHRADQVGGTFPTVARQQLRGHR